MVVSGLEEFLTATYIHTNIDDGFLQGGWVVIDIVGAEGEHAHEEEEEEPVEPSPGVTW